MKSAKRCFVRFLMALDAACVLGALIMGTAAARADPKQEQACYRWPEDPDPAIEACTEAIRTHCVPAGRCLEDFRKADFGRLFVYRGLAYANLKGDYRRAISDFNEVIKIVPSEFPREINDAYCGRAFAYIGLGEYDRAISSIEEFFSKFDVKEDTVFGTNSDAFGLRGVAYSRKGVYERAIADLTVAIKLYSRDALFHTERGTAYTGKGWHERALTDHDTAIRIDRTNVIAHVRRGQTWEAKGERERAIEDYNKAVTFRAKVQWERDEQAVARRRLAALKHSLRQL